MLGGPMAKTPANVLVTIAAEIRRLERDLDARLGPHGRRWMYHELPAHPAGVHALAMFRDHRR
jgi:hypothetical protein